MQGDESPPELYHPKRDNEGVRMKLAQVIQCPECKNKIDIDEYGALMVEDE